MEWSERVLRWLGRGAPDEAPRDEGHLGQAADSLRALLSDPSIPADLRESLAADYAQVEAMLDKIEHGHVHIAVFGRVSVGKSALLNALLGRDAFEVACCTEPRHAPPANSGRKPAPTACT